MSQRLIKQGLTREEESLSMAMTVLPRVELDKWADYFAEMRLEGDEFATGVAKLIALVSSGVKDVLSGELQKVGETLTVMPVSFTGKVPVEVGQTILEPGDRYCRISVNSQSSGPSNFREFADNEMVKGRKFSPDLRAEHAVKFDDLVAADLRFLAKTIKDSPDWDGINFLGERLRVSSKRERAIKNGFTIFSIPKPGHFGLISKVQFLERFGS